MTNVSLHQITRWQDPDLPDVLDLYQTSFPADEQMRLSWWVRLLNEMSQQTGPAQPERLLYAAVEGCGNGVVGFAYAEVYGSQHTAYLMYLAIRGDRRGQGLGAVVYQQVREELFNRKYCDVLLFEVEKPEIMLRESPDASRTAQRRICWYERQGARLLEGIHYVQSVGWQPPLEMRLMFHSRTPVSPEQAFSTAAALLGDGVKQAGRLYWRSVRE
jgi:hypothetical protein